MPDVLSDYAAILERAVGEPAVALAEEPLPDLVAALRTATDRLRDPEADTAGLDSLVGALVEAIGVRPGGVEEIVAWADADPPLSEARLHRLANRVAWITRGRAQGLDAYRPSRGKRWQAWMVLERFRFVFDARAIRETLTLIPDEAVEQDELFLAFRAFHVVRLTTSALEAESAIDYALDRRGIVSDGSAQHNAAVFDILAHAVWLNYTLPDQGRLLQDVCERAVAAVGGDPSPVMLFRYAAALRLQGRDDEAIVKVESAMTRLRGDSEFVRTFSEQLVRERELCVAGRFMHRQHDEVAQVIDRVESKVADADRKSLTHIIQIVTLFTAVVAFALGGGSAATDKLSESPRDTLIVLGGFGSVLVTFAMIVYCMIEVSVRERSSNRRLLVMAGVVLAVCVLQFLGLYFASEFAFPE